MGSTRDRRRLVEKRAPAVKRHNISVDDLHAITPTIEVLYFGTPHRILTSGSHKPIVFQLESEQGPAGLWAVKAP